MASRKLNSLLNKYSLENIKIHEKYIYDNGYNCDTKISDKIEDPEPKNLYDLQIANATTNFYAKPILTYEHI
jgi:hypothetical protein